MFQQLLYACFQMQQLLKGDLFRKIWDLVNYSDEAGSNGILFDDDGDALYGSDVPKGGNRINTPVTTRWWGLIVASIHVINYWDDWKRVALKVIDSNTCKSLPWKVASDVYSLLCEEEIKADLLFLCAFGKDVYMPALHWLQGQDEHAKLYGHRACSMAEFWYSTHCKLTSLINNGWKQKYRYKSVVAMHLTDTVCMETQERKIDIFLAKFIETATKHFNPWLSTPNVVCAVAGETPLAAAFARWLLDGSLPSAESGEYKSQTHDDYVFNIRNYVSFVVKEVVRAEITDTQWFRNHQRGLEEISQCVSLWDKTDATSTALSTFRQYAQERFLPILSSTHWIKFLIKETSLVATTRRDEGMRSAIVMVRSVINPDVTLRSTGVRKGDETKRPPRGVSRNKTLLEKALEIKRVSQEANISTDKRREMANYYDKSGNSAKRTRLEMEFDKVVNAPSKKPNSVMLREGVDHTPAVQGKVDFGKLRAKVHKKYVVEELHLREITASENDKWNDLRQKMKDAEHIHDDEKKVWFEPKTDGLKGFLNGEAETSTPLI